MENEKRFVEKRVTRRKFLGTALKIGAAAAAYPILAKTTPLFRSEAFAAKKGKGGKTPKDSIVFLSAENITGNWDPTSHTTLAQLNVEAFVFNYLIRCPMRVDNPQEIVYELATAQKIVDPYIIEYKLRDGVKFHDGKPFSSEDVKATFEYASDPNKAAGAWYPGQCEVEIVDKLTCRVHTKKWGYPATLFWYQTSFLPIMSANDIKNPQILAQRLNGTGAFKFVRQEKDDTVMAANENFFKGAPKIKDLHFIYVPDSTTRLISLQSGESDIIERLETEQVDVVEKDKNLKLNSAVSVENKYLWFRCSKPPFDDWRVRRAACHAIDRNQIWQVLGKSGYPSYTHISPVKFGYTKVPEYPEFNPEMSQKFLKEAGYPGGKGLPELEYITSVGFYPKTKEYGEVITAMLNQAGFNVKLSVLETAAWNQKLYDRPGGGPGHMIDCGWCTGSPEPDLILRMHFHSSSKRITGIVDKEIDASLDKERNAMSIDARKTILQKETLPLLAKKVPSLSLFTSVFIHAINNKIENYYIYPNGMADFEKTTKSV
jgi:peptide/nickel transport system substrate-binding protein